MFNRLLKSLAAKPLGPTDSWAFQIAERSAPAIFARVVGRTTRMTLCETRGYIRARAAGEIRRQTRTTLVNSVLAQSTDASGDLARFLVGSATERVIPIVLRQLTAAASMTAAHATAQRPPSATSLQRAA